MATYKLHYFENRGRAECIRLLFVLKGQDFEDIRYTFDEWLQKKESISEYHDPRSAMYYRYLEAILSNLTFMFAF